MKDSKKLKINGVIARLMKGKRMGGEFYAFRQWFELQEICKHLCRKIAWLWFFLITTPRMEILQTGGEFPDPGTALILDIFPKCFYGREYQNALKTANTS